MLPSLNSAISGLNCNNMLMSIIGNNVANTNTVGYKECTASFSEVLSQSLGGVSNGAQIGRGVKMTNISPIFTQSSLEATQSPTDLAISGEGFFSVKNPESGLTYYTRAGNFIFNKEGNLVTPEGNVLQGWPIVNEEMQGATMDINLSGFSFTPKATSTIDMGLNLDSTEPIIAGGFVAATPASTSNFSSNITAYDSLGNSHDIAVYFTKTADNTWTYNAATETGTINTGGNGTIAFNSDGTQDAAASSTSDLDISFENGPAANQLINFDFGNTTQYATSSTLNSMVQDGYGSGSLLTIGIDLDGLITGISTNGCVQELAKIVVATFESPWGLSKIGDNLFAEARDSGTPITSQTGGGSIGSILASTLESSNVDLGAQFMKMIIVQRSYQANARVITTSDQLLNEMVNLKR